jgi:hypothetical protein
MSSHAGTYQAEPVHNDDASISTRQHATQEYLYYPLAQRHAETGFSVFRECLGANQFHALPEGTLLRFSRDDISFERPVYRSS